MIYIFKESYKEIEGKNDRVLAGKFSSVITKCLNHISGNITERDNEIVILTKEKEISLYNYFFFEGYQKNDFLKMDTTLRKVINNKLVKFHFIDFNNFKHNYDKFNNDIIFDDSGMVERVLYANELLDNRCVFSLERIEGELTGGLNQKKYEVIDIS